MTETHHDQDHGTARVGRARKAVRLDATQLVEFAPLVAGQSLPLLVHARVEELSLPEWLRLNRERCETELRHHGALLLRGFQPPAIETFEQIMQAFSGDLLDYTYGSTPRAVVSGRVYTSTEYPSELAIPLHNEMSYARQWPMTIGFLCVTAPQSGGETPIADSRRIYTRIPAAIRTRFAERGVMYLRNYGAGLDVSWQASFQSDDRAVVEAYCRANDISFSWTDDDGLHTRQICQGVATHPQTNATVWFNQAHLFHVSNLDPITRDLLTTNLAGDKLPRNACYGDGKPFDDAELDAIREVLERESVCFSWQRGDVLLLDNMLTAHGRRPFSGARRIVVGMSQAFNATIG